MRAKRAKKNGSKKKLRIFEWIAVRYKAFGFFFFFFFANKSGRTREKKVHVTFLRRFLYTSRIRLNNTEDYLVVFFFAKTSCLLYNVTFVLILELDTHVIRSTCNYEPWNFLYPLDFLQETIDSINT